MSAKKLLVVQVAALGHDFLRRHRGADWDGLTFRPIESVFPALTSTVQASFRTAAPPAVHGMVANGLFDRAYGRARFWEQSASLVAGPRIWDNWRAGGGRVAVLFWQQSMGESADVVLTPAPIHKHHGGIIGDCYSRPPGLYEALRRGLGPFNLARYWGPMASWKSSRWIAGATARVVSDPGLNVGLCLTYLPALDYDLQRFGPDHPVCSATLRRVFEQLGALRAAASSAGFELLVFGDYAIGGCAGGAIAVNRALRERGFLACRAVRGMAYPDFAASRAFAVADHEVAHVYVRSSADIAGAGAAIASLDGVARVLSGQQIAEAGLAHPNCGELVAVAREGRWFAYPWWSGSREAPDYARHVDIHNKPGYDPCELFFGWPPGSVCADPSRVRGSHGLAGPSRMACWASTLPLGAPATLVELASEVRKWLERDTQPA